jgi:type I restriction enzyme M protein
MTEILKPQPGETVYDPTCGSAGMLISCIHYLREHGAEWRGMKCYGQEINPLSAAIGKMNLFLNGVLNFKIVNADTLKYPAFTEAGQLQQFDIVLANPPYSISSWGRDAFETDQYGRNFLGVPPQGKADYAFFQHILKSLKPNGGRCAILFPHGVLTRDEEYDMRKKLIHLDWVECIIGIGKNLFYNSPMEACIVICNTGKPKDRKGKILFINAKDEITRKNAQSYLEDCHIQRIANSYNNFATEDGFSAVATIEEISSEKNDYSLGISKYVTGAIDPPASKEELDLAITQWLGGSNSIRDAYKRLNEMISGGEQNVES